MKYLTLLLIALAVIKTQDVDNLAADIKAKIAAETAALNAQIQQDFETELKTFVNGQKLNSKEVKFFQKNSLTIKFQANCDVKFLKPPKTISSECMDVQTKTEELVKLIAKVVNVNKIEDSLTVVKNLINCVAELTRKQTLTFVAKDCLGEELQTLTAKIQNYIDGKMSGSGYTKSGNEYVKEEKKEIQKAII